MRSQAQRVGARARHARMAAATATPSEASATRVVAKARSPGPSGGNGEGPVRAGRVIVTSRRRAEPDAPGVAPPKSKEAPRCERLKSHKGALPRTKPVATNPAARARPAASGRPRLVITTASDGTR